MKTYLILSVVLLYALEGMAMQRHPSNAKDVPQEQQETPSRHHQQQDMLTRHQELLVGYGEAINTLNIAARDHTAALEKLQRRHNYTTLCCVVSLTMAIFSIFKRR